MSPALLDLCDVTIVHRFTSPAWFAAIKKHIAGASMGDESEHPAAFSGRLFQRIVKLKTGEALVFCPTALLDTVWIGSGNSSGTYSEVDEDSDSGVEINAQSVSQWARDTFISKFSSRKVMQSTGWQCFLRPSYRICFVLSFQ